MEPGPLELIVVKFPGNQLTGEITPALGDLIDRDVIRVIDIVFMEKGPDGEVSVKEINDLQDDDYEQFDPVVEDVTGLLSDEDIELVSEGLENNSSAAMMLFEHRWATEFRDAVVRSKGELVMSERIPREAVLAALQARAETNGN